MTKPQPYFRTFTPPAGTNVTEQERHDAAAASREAVREQMAYDSALGRPRVAQPELAPIKAPELPPDFAQRVAALDKEIYSRGIAIDADKLVSFGKQRFEQLLAAERKARGPGHVQFGELTLFENVQRAMHAFEAPTVPRRTMMEQTTGAAKELDQIRAIRSFDELWKFSSVEPEAVRLVYAAHDLFTALCFGQSMLERLSPDGRLRSRLFCNGKGPKVDLFRQWLSVLQGPLVSVTLAQPLFSLFAWLAGGKAEPPDMLGLARNWFGLRVPSKEQIALAQSVLDGYLLGYRDWQLWEYVGRRTRTATDEGRLSAWRKELGAHYPRITAWHDEVRSGFNRDVGYGFDSHRVFEPDRHRAFLDRMIREFRDLSAALLALGIAETCPGAVIARFQNAVFVEDGKHKLKEKRAQVARLLQAAFPGSNFQLEFEEVLP